MIRKLQRQLYETAEYQGHHKDLPADRYGTLVRLCLIHTEISEASQVVKRHGVDHDEALAMIEEELADACIRIFELAEHLGFDLESAILHKDEINRDRPYRYGHPDEGKNFTDTL